MTPVERVIMLVDMNAFFAQVEQRCAPALRGKPVLVGGAPGARTVVTAASYEAKAFGVASGMSSREALALCPDAVIVEGDQNKYIEYCRRIADICGEFTDRVEVYSIDEAFLDVTRVPGAGDPEALAARLKERIREELGLTCSIGIGPGKLAAKMACNWRKPDGLFRIHPGELPRIMWNLPVEELVGVGGRLKARLNRMGIHTIGDLARRSPESLRRRLGVYGEYLHRLANGDDDDPVNPGAPGPVKSMGHSYTLPRDTGDARLLGWHLFWLSDRVARRLRRNGYAGRTVTLVVRTEDFITFTRSRTLPRPTCAPREIHAAAMELLALNAPGAKIRLVGVSVSNLAPASRVQLSLVEDVLAEEKVLGVMDRIRDRYGEEAIGFAALYAGAPGLRKKVGFFLTKREKRGGEEVKASGWGSQPARRAPASRALTP
ncbi:MAG: DNA polymerase IV [bacterium]